MFQPSVHSDSSTCDRRPSAIGRVGAGALIWLAFLVPAVALGAEAPTSGPDWAWFGITGLNFVLSVGSGWVGSQARRAQDRETAARERRFADIEGKVRTVNEQVDKRFQALEAKGGAAAEVLDRRFQRVHDKLAEKGDKSTQDELRAELRELRQRQERQERQIGGLQQELRHQMELNNTKLDSLAEQLANIVKLLEAPR